MNIVIKNRQPEFEKLLSNHQSISVMGMPGSGITLFLKEMAKVTTSKNYWVDIFALPELSMEALFTALAGTLETKDKTVGGCKKQLEKIAHHKQPVVIYFAGFDQLAPKIDKELLQALNSLARADHVKLVFGLCVSLKKFIPDAAFDSGLRLFGAVYYLKPYTTDELRYWLKSYGPSGWQKHPKLQESIELSGGHVQLLLLLLQNDRALSDGQTDSIKLLFKNLHTHLLAPQRTVLRKVATNEKQVDPDEYLLGIGMVVYEQGRYQLFSRLFSDYLRSQVTHHLPVKERRLYLVLNRHRGQVVSKHEIIDVVWQGEIVSDWALNALVYRLRKHPAFTIKHVDIENHKKLGYVLVKN